MIYRPLPDTALLRERYAYDPATGAVTFAYGIKKLGKAVGSRHHEGYLTTAIDNRQMPLHRLIWKLVTGHDAPGEIDHINGDRSDNRWANLRLATPMQNRRNRKRRRDSTSPYKGIHYDASRGTSKPWRAKIVVDYRQIHIGWFATAEEARAAYIAASATHHGEFSRELTQAGA